MNPFTDILAVLGPNGEHWLKGSPWNPMRTSFCVTGAMAVARNETWYNVKDCDVDFTVRDILADIIRAEFPTRFLENRQDPWHLSIDFNDHIDTTFPEVRAVLEKGQARWDEEHIP